MTTARFALPLLQMGQSQKEVTHNECVQALENIVQPVVEGAPSDQPPLTPILGGQYLVGNQPEGAFAERGKNLATWTEAGWLFTAPRPMMAVVDGGTGQTWVFNDGVWQLGVVHAAEVQIDGEKVLGARLPAIISPTGGTVVDVESRIGIAAILTALRQHGLIAT